MARLNELPLSSVCDDKEQNVVSWYIFLLLKAIRPSWTRPVNLPIDKRGVLVFSRMIHSPIVWTKPSNKTCSTRPLVVPLVAGDVEKDLILISGKPLKSEVTSFASDYCVYKHMLGQNMRQDLGWPIISSVIIYYFISNQFISSPLIKSLRL